MTVQLLAGGSSGVGFTGGLNVSMGDLQSLILSVQAELSASLNAVASLQANISIDPTITIQAALGFAADASAALALAGPSLTAGLSAGLDAQLALSASLSAKLGLLQVELLNLQAQLAALAGVFVYLYTGAPGGLGAELGARVSSDCSSPLVSVVAVAATTDASASAVLSVLGM